METFKVNLAGELMRKTALCIILKMVDSILSTAEDIMMINNLLGKIAPKLILGFGAIINLVFLYTLLSLLL